MPAFQPKQQYNFTSTQIDLIAFALNQFYNSMNDLEVNEYEKIIEEINRPQEIS